jgi:capsular exopolysaccharide synthesis family protein
VLIGAVTLDEALINIEEYGNNLFFFPAGTIPPNPAELLLSPATKQLFDVLKKRFDYIIIDSAPLVVTDSSILSEYVDSVLFVTRINHTYKENVKQIEQLRREKRYPNPGLVVNDIDMEQSGYSYYGYGYGYGSYHYYGYYHSDDKRGKKKKIKPAKEK